jgi:sugar phosphate isomerase/epimerase
VHPLALDPITTGLVPPPELIRIAAACGLRHANLTVRGQGTFVLPYDLLGDRRMQRATRNGAHDLGVTLGIAGTFFLEPSTDIETQLSDFERGFAVAAQLGCRAANVLSFDPQPARRAEGFARFCERARSHGLGVTLEMFRQSAVDRWEVALPLLETANAQLNADVLHLVRCNVAPAQLKALDPARVGLMQLSDGPLELDAANEDVEAREERLIPGQGGFPLRDYLAALPGGVPVSLEVPSYRAIRETSPEAWARKVVGETRRLLEAL